MPCMVYCEQCQSMKKNHLSNINDGSLHRFIYCTNFGAHFWPDFVPHLHILTFMIMPPFFGLRSSIILVGNERERTTLGRGFLSFHIYFGDNSVLFRYCLVQRPFCMFLLFSSDLWSGIFFLLLFLLSLPLLIGNFLSFFAFSLSLIGDFPSFCVFFRGQGLIFSPWVKVYGKLGFWLKACSTAGHDICQGLV